VFASILLILNHILFARTRDFKIWTMIIELHIFFPIVLWKILINSKKTLQDNKFKKYIRKDNEKLFYRGL
jgi:hypothetical protein